MNFQDLSKIESAKGYLDMAFVAGRKKASEMRAAKLQGSRLTKSRRIETDRVKVMGKVASSNLAGIVERFPRLDDLPQFYNQLVRLTLEYDKVKVALSHVRWTSDKIKELAHLTERRIVSCVEVARVNKFRREFSGRLSSLLGGIKKDLEVLEEARKVMKRYPTIKTGLKTVAIAGFPNVGKTTLLSKLTGSTPDIKPYAFTTKGLNVGYRKEGHHRVQYVDTPGTLNRFDRMNAIEKIAHLAIKLVAEKVIYVFDPTEPYPLDQQLKLYKKTLELGKPVACYVSKSDVVSRGALDLFVKKLPKGSTCDAEEL